MRRRITFTHGEREEKRENVKCVYVGGRQESGRYESTIDRQRFSLALSVGPTRGSLPFFLGGGESGEFSRPTRDRFSNGEKEKTGMEW